MRVARAQMLAHVASTEMTEDTETVGLYLGGGAEAQRPGIYGEQRERRTCVVRKTRYPSEHLAIRHSQATECLGA